MVEVKELQVNDEAVTPKGHKIVILEHREKSTVVKVLASQKELDIPNWQLVTPVREYQTAVEPASVGVPTSPE